jgi:hypothetical protein
MSRYRYEVKLFGATDVLENIVYKRVEEDAAKGRETFSIEAYKEIISKKSKVVSQEIPSWYIGSITGEAGMTSF